MFVEVYCLLSMRNTGTTEEVDKFSRRQVRVTKEHNEECRKLLGLMGIPVVVVRDSEWCPLPLIDVCRLLLKLRPNVLNSLEEARYEHSNQL